MSHDPLPILAEPSAPEVDETAPETPRFPKQKRRYRKVEIVEEEEAFAEQDEIALLSSALELARSRRKQSEETQRPTHTTINRFVPVSEAPVEPEELTPAAEAIGDAKGNVALLKFKASPAETLPQAEDRERGPWAWRALPFAGAAICLAAGFLVGRQTGGRDAIVAAKGANLPAAVSTVWLPQHFETMRQARAAEHAGDLRTALRLTGELSKSVEFDPALLAYRATLSTRLGNFNDAEADASRLLSQNVSPDTSAVLNAALAFNFVRWRQFKPADETFALVAQADPGDALNLLRWAETLRRAGSLPAAADKFEQALSRLDFATPYAEPQREYIAYARRLALVEAGRESELQPELDGRMAAPAPSGYWLLTKAAASLQKNDLSAAVINLQKARAVFSAGEFRTLLADYFFRSFSNHPEVTPFLTSFTPEEQQARFLSMDYFVDP